MQAESADTLLSFPKSGRTWLGFLYVYYACYVTQRRPERFIDRLHKDMRMYKPTESPAFVRLVEQGAVPAIRFHHSFPVVPYYEIDLRLDRSAPGDAGMLLVRDPRDVVVSYFHHVMGKAESARASGKPRPAGDVDLSEFLRVESYGIRVVVAYMNQAVERAPSVYGRFEVLAFEDLMADTRRWFSRFLEFFGVTPIMGAVDAAVARASFAALQELERAERPRLASVATRFRRGLVGGWRDEFSEADQQFVDRVLAAHLCPAFSRYM